MNPPPEDEAVEGAPETMVVRDDEESVWEPPEELLRISVAVAKPRCDNPHLGVSVGVVGQALDRVVLQDDVVVAD